MNNEQKKKDSAEHLAWLAEVIAIAYRSAEKFNNASIREKADALYERYKQEKTYYLSL